MEPNLNEGTRLEILEKQLYATNICINSILNHNVEIDNRIKALKVEIVELKIKEEVKCKTIKELENQMNEFEINQTWAMSNLDTSTRNFSSILRDQKTDMEKRLNELKIVEDMQDDINDTLIERIDNLILKVGGLEESINTKKTIKKIVRIDMTNN